MVFPQIIPALLGFLVFITARWLLKKRWPQGKLAKNIARLLQIATVTITSSILTSLTLSFFSFLPTLFYAGILATDLILSGLLEIASNFIKPILKRLIEWLSKIRIIKRIRDWLRPHIIRIRWLIRKIKRNWIIKWLLLLFGLILALFEDFLYPKIIKPLVFVWLISVLEGLENWIGWLCENIIDPLLGEIIAMIVKFIGVISIRIPRFALELIQVILDRIFHKAEEK